MSIGVTILGATGSVGNSTLDVISRHPGRFHLVAVTANTNAARMIEICKQYQPRQVVMADPVAAEQVRKAVDTVKIEVLNGEDAISMVAAQPESEYVMAAIVGAAGLLPTLSAASTGKRLLLANKEALVMSGKLFMNVVNDNDTLLLPIDSEHNAIFQCMPVKAGDAKENGIRRILLTASGGPFRTLPVDRFDDITPSQAVAHPNWDMGEKISVDSATMMNKGLEVIEAHWLFGLSPDQIQVVIHPQSIVHSLVSYSDGSVLAQMGNPDMRTPIAHALAWPERIESGVQSLDLFEVEQLDFERPDRKRFPCLGLAYSALEAGGGAPVVMNAANEIAVEAFLGGKIPYKAIHNVIEHCLEADRSDDVSSIENILEIDRHGRTIAREFAGTLH